MPSFYFICVKNNHITNKTSKNSFLITIINVTIQLVINSSSINKFSKQNSFKIGCEKFPVCEFNTIMIIES